MPRREEIVIRSEGDAGVPLRASLMRPDHANGGRRAAVAINRGMAVSESEIDLLEALAGSLAEAGIITALLEPRTAKLILDDFNAFSLADEVSDVLASVRWLHGVEAVDADRVGLVGWSIGAIAAVEAAMQSPLLTRLCLVNPATPSLIESRLSKAGNGAASTSESLSKNYAGDVIALANRESSLALPQPLQIVHAAADRIVHPDVSLEFLSNRSAASGPVERWLVARADHAFSDAASRAAVFERVAAFFAEARAPAARTARGIVGAAT